MCLLPALEPHQAESPRRTRIGISRLCSAFWTLEQIIDAGEGQPINSAVFSHDGATVFLHAADGMLYSLDVDTSTIARGPTVGEPISNGVMPTLALSPRDDILLVGLADGVQMWDLQSGQAIGGPFPNRQLDYGAPSYGGRIALTAVD